MCGSNSKKRNSKKQFEIYCRFDIIIMFYLKGKRRLWKSPVIVMPEGDGFDSPIAEKKAKLEVND